MAASWSGIPLGTSSDNTLRLWGADGAPLATLNGHTSIVTGALATADGRFLSWSWDNTLRLWGADGAPLATLKGHAHEVLGALATADGRFLSWDSRGTYRLWENDGSALGEIDRGEADRLQAEVRRAASEVIWWRTNGTALTGTATATGLLVCRFISDASLYTDTVAQLPGGVVAVGGAGGAMHFLRPNRALRRLMDGGDTQQ